MFEMKTFPYRSFKQADEEMSEGIEEAGPSTLIDEELSEGIEDSSPAIVIDAQNEQETEEQEENPVQPEILIPARSPTSEGSLFQIPEVVSIVLDFDNPSLPEITIRTVILGTVAIMTLAPFKTRELFVENVFEMPMVFIQLILALWAGKLMAAVLPTRLFTIPGTELTFSLNPGAFNEKEHTLIAVCAYIGMNRPNLIQTVGVMNQYFHKDIFWTTAYMAILASYFLCFLFVGTFTNLVTSPQMWWPTELLDVMFFRTWHEENGRTLWNMSRRSFFLVVFIASAILQMVSSYVFPSMSALSSLCWIWKNSTTAHQIGSGLFGLGLFSFSLDWSSITSFAGDPLAIPRVVILNVMVGYFILMYLVTPLVYWTNAFGTQNFPMLSAELFDKFGNIYDISRVLNNDGVTLNETAFRDYSDVYMSAFTRASYAMMIASVFISLVNIVLNWRTYREGREDIHNRLMEQYDRIPGSWFITTSGLAFVLVVICTLTGFGPHIGFPFLAVLAALGTAFILAIPFSFFAAETTQMIPVNVAFGLIGGVLFPNKPFEYMVFNSFAYQTVANAVQFLSFLKLSHYMKIAPKAMFKVVIAASILSCSVSFAEAWYQLSKTDNNCAPQGSPTGSNSACPWLDMFYNTSNLWGIIGSWRILHQGNYITFVLFVVIVSTIAQVLLSIFSRQWEFLRSINLPIILAVPYGFPAATASNLNSFLIAALLIHYIAPRYIRRWSPQARYLLSISLLAGTGLASGILLPILLKLGKMPDWWGSPLQDHCPLAKCPTSSVAGCPNVRL